MVPPPTVIPALNLAPQVTVIFFMHSALTVPSLRLWVCSSDPASASPSSLIQSHPPLVHLKAEASDVGSISTGGWFSSALGSSSSAPWGPGGPRPPSHLKTLDLVNLVPGLGVVLQGIAGVGEVWGGVWDSTAVFVVTLVMLQVVGTS